MLTSVAQALRQLPPSLQGLTYFTGLQRRCLSLHEHQAQKVLRDYGIKVANGKVASNPAGALDVAKSLSSKSYVIKAQVLAGGRGKGHFTSGLQGGVKVCETPEQVQQYAEQMIGHTLITKQTGQAGKPCNQVFVVERLYPKHEYYLAILLDRKAANPVVVASAEGGMDIEAIAEKNPDAIIKTPVNINEGITAAQTAGIADRLGLKGLQAEQAASTISSLYKLFREKDASLVEINPLSLLEDGTVLCMDAKINIDENASFRQSELFALRDYTQEDNREVEASKADLNYVGLDGNIGCMVNGAGLAMATMDIIKLHMGEPANFLDVGGSATAQQIVSAFKIISSDPRVKSILINVFGGIMRCDVVAKGIVDACQQLELNIPLVVRLQGTNADIGHDIIAESGMKIYSQDDLDLAAKKAVELLAT